MVKYKLEKINLERYTDLKSGFILPVKKRPIKIMQGYNGPWSHLAYKLLFKNKEFIFDDSYSIDFEVPFGTEVIAAKDGVVYYTVHSKKFYEGYDFEKGMNVSAGFIVLNHGSYFSLYSHMGEFETRISRGLALKQGEVIGKTGKTGWVSQIPHVHFEIFEIENPFLGFKQSVNPEIQKNSVRFERLSQPVCFEDYHGSLEHKLIHSS